MIHLCREGLEPRAIPVVNHPPPVEDNILSLCHRGADFHMELPILVSKGNPADNQTPLVEDTFSKLYQRGADFQM